MLQTFEMKIGRITGVKRENDIIFRGIPYAKTHRFEKPILIDELGEFDASRIELDCFQRSTYDDDRDTFYYKEFCREQLEFRYDESPMTLNIITPALKAKNPVLVFIHGGGFECGKIGELPYGDTTEYSKRNIVLVSVSYRLNAFGHYRGTNFGLMDQLTAIDWVRMNIEEFGGDPDNITIMGQSAGAMSITDLLMSGRLDGKIKQAIMMSGAGAVPRMFGPKKRKKTQDFWDRVDEKLIFKPDVAEPERLWWAWYNAKNTDTPLGKIRHIQPSIDGEILKESQHKALRKGHVTDVPMIVGITSQDMMPLFVYKMAMKFALTLSRKKHKPIYGYLFDRVLPGNNYKAFHGSDLWYMFGNMDRSKRPFEELDYKLCAEMIDNVAEFCNTGKPKDPNWLPVTSKQKGFRHFDGESKGLAFPSYINGKMRETFFKDHGPA